MKIRKMLYICLCVILQCFIKETSKFYFLYLLPPLPSICFLRCHPDPWLVYSLCSSVNYKLMSLVPQPSKLLVYEFELPCPLNITFKSSS